MSDLGKHTPPVTSSAIGRMLAPVVGHVKRKTAVRQADMWNEVLERETGDAQPAYRVDVGDRAPDGLWYLVWRDRNPEGRREET